MVDLGRLFNVFTLAFTVILPIVGSVRLGAVTRRRRFIPVLPAWCAVPFVLNQVLAKVLASALPERVGAIQPLVQCVTEIKETNASPSRDAGERGAPGRRRRAPWRHAAATHPQAVGLQTLTIGSSLGLHSPQRPHCSALVQTLPASRGARHTVLLSHQPFRQYAISPPW